MDDPWELVNLWANHSGRPSLPVEALKELLRHEGFIIVHRSRRVDEAVSLDARDAFGEALHGAGWWDDSPDEVVDEPRPT